MRLKTIGFSLAALSLSIASPASADNIADCEIVILQTVEDESGRGGAQVASYGPADEFLGSVYGENTEVFNKVGGLPIQAVMCKRIDIVPTKNDFKILATGIPLFLSQSFDSQSSDLISLFYKDGEFRQTYSGPGLTEETEGLIETRLAEFNAMDHTLELNAIASEDMSEEEKSEDEETTDEMQENVSENDGDDSLAEKIADEIDEEELVLDEPVAENIDDKENEEIVAVLNEDNLPAEAALELADVPKDTPKDRISPVSEDIISEKIEEKVDAISASSTEDMTATLEDSLEAE